MHCLLTDPLIRLVGMADDVGITLRVPDITIPDADYEDGPAKTRQARPTRNINLDYKKEDSNTNPTRTLVNPSLVDI